MNPKRHSYSRINQFTWCPRFHYFSATQGKWVESAAMAKGTQIHAALEAVGLGLAAGLSMEDALAVEFEMPEGPLDAQAVSAYVQRTIPLWEQLRPRKHGVEKWFADAGGLEIVGKIDLVSDTTPSFDEYGALLDEPPVNEPCVVDWKSTASPRRIKTVREARNSLQLQLYCLATGLKNAGFVYLLPGLAPRGVFVTFTESRLALARAWLKGTIESIDRHWAVAAEGQPEGTYDPTVFALAEPGHPWCGPRACEFFDQCLGKDT